MAQREENQELVSEVRAKAEELDRLLSQFGDRLRRMRQRNREVENEITSFEQELDRLREWLNGHR